jgi:hypothetical protein
MYFKKIRYQFDDINSFGELFFYPRNFLNLAVDFGSFAGFVSICEMIYTDEMSCYVSFEDDKPIAFIMTENHKQSEGLIYVHIGSRDGNYNFIEHFAGLEKTIKEDKKPKILKALIPSDLKTVIKLVKKMGASETNIWFDKDGFELKEFTKEV